MSSIMRWRSGLIEHVVIGNSCLIEVETSIFRNPFEGLLEEIHWRLPPAARTVYPSKLSRSDLVLWLKADLQSAENEVCSTPRNGHFRGLG
jgi:hypothetical protein